MSLLAQDQRLTRRVGTIALVALVASILFFLFLLGRLELGSPTRIRVFFRTTASLKEHAPLVVAGQSIGRVEALDPVPHGGANPLAGEVGTVAVVAIDGGQAWKVPHNAEIFVSSHGPLSDRYLEVGPPHGEPGPPVRDGDQLRGIDPPSLDAVLSHTWNDINTMRAFVAEIRPELDAFRDGLGTLVDELDAIAADAATRHPDSSVVELIANTRALIAGAALTYEVELGGQPGMARLSQAIDSARQTFAQARAMIAQLRPRVSTLVTDLERVQDHIAAHDPPTRLAAAIDRVTAVIDRLDPLLAKAQELADRFARGEGSLARLMNDPEFPEDAKELGKIMKRQPWKVIARPKN